MDSKILPVSSLQRVNPAHDHFGHIVSDSWSHISSKGSVSMRCHICKTAQMNVTPSNTSSSWWSNAPFNYFLLYVVFFKIHFFKKSTFDFCYLFIYIYFFIFLAYFYFVDAFKKHSNVLLFLIYCFIVMRKQSVLLKKEKLSYCAFDLMM